MKSPAVYVLLVIAMLLPAVSLRSQTIGFDRLGDVALEFSEALAVSARPGATRLLRLDTLPGDRLRLYLPFHPNRVRWLLSDGAPVEPGQSLAQLYGPELEHWLLEVAMLQQRFEGARARYERNGPLYQQRAMSAEVWQSIVDRYHGLRLEQQHMSHVLEWLHVESAEGEEAVATLRAPRAGIALSPEHTSMGGAVDEYLAAEIVDPGSLRLTTLVPQSGAGDIVALGTVDCDLPLARDAQRVSGFSRRLWSAPVGDCLPLRPGLTVSGYALYRFAGQAVPRSAVLSFRGQTMLALESDAGLQLVPITIAGEDSEQFYVTSTTPLSGTRVLIRSASAVQGLLLGLGEG